jgi:hypothetical protein
MGIDISLLKKSPRKLHKAIPSSVKNQTKKSFLLEVPDVKDKIEIEKQECFLRLFNPIYKQNIWSKFDQL